MKVRIFRPSRFSAAVVLGWTSFATDRASALRSIAGEIGVLQSVAGASVLERGALERGETQRSCFSLGGGRRESALNRVPRLPSHDDGLRFGASGPVGMAHPFSLVDRDALGALARASTRRTFGHNEFVYMQDDAAQHLFFAQSGFVRLSYLMEDGSTVLHSVLPPGESFGELGIFEGSTYPEMATAVGTLSTTCVSASAFQSLCRQHPSLSDALGQAIAKRYRSYILLTRDLSLKSLAGRLAQAVLRLADGLRLPAHHGGRSYPCIGPMITQTDLSLMARGSRGNVNRALKRWESAGWIMFRDRSILILDRLSLERVAIEERA